MTDPYKILGIALDATDEEVRKAYKQLSIKYHPDHNSGSPLQDLAEEKMKEINDAFDKIMDMRRGTNTSYTQKSSNENNTDEQFNEIRRNIKAGNFTVADKMLENLSTARNAEWYFLKGSVCYGLGWLNDAYTHFSKAVNMEPSNAEYKSALERMNYKRQGNMNGNPYRTNSTGGCSGCDLCSGLICADCCCECFGGDIIPCC